MGDEFDVDDLLEAPYKVKNEPEVSSEVLTKFKYLRSCLLWFMWQLKEKFNCKFK